MRKECGELFKLEGRRGSGQDFFDLVNGNIVDSVVTITYWQTSGRVDPNTDRAPKWKWVAVSTMDRIDRKEEPLFSDILEETTVPNPHL